MQWYLKEVALWVAEVQLLGYVACQAAMLREGFKWVVRS